jgi:hypothetical protein
MERGWTIETLKEHFEKLREADNEATKIALAAAKEAVQIAENNAEKWRQSANEWRGAMNDKDKNFITRREIWIAMVAIAGIVVALMGYFKK